MTTDAETIECPGCYTANSASRAHCSRCGNELDDFRGAAQQGATKHACPRCDKSLWQLRHDGLALEECRTCGGYWLDDASFDKAKERSALLGQATPPTAPRARPIETVRYVRCPICQKQMSRINFAKISGVILDVCRGHGTWFDRDELHAVLTFIEQGGLDRARQKDAERLKDAQRDLEAKRRAAAAQPSPGHHDHEEAGVVGTTATIVGAVFEILAALI